MRQLVDTLNICNDIFEHIHTFCFFVFFLKQGVNVIFEFLIMLLLNCIENLITHKLSFKAGLSYIFKYCLEGIFKVRLSPKSSTFRGQVHVHIVRHVTYYSLLKPPTAVLFSKLSLFASVTVAKFFPCTFYIKKVVCLYFVSKKCQTVCMNKDRGQSKMKHPNQSAIYEYQGHFVQVPCSFPAVTVYICLK